MRFQSKPANRHPAPQGRFDQAQISRPLRRTRRIGVFQQIVVHEQQRAGIGRVRQAKGVVEITRPQRPLPRNGHKSIRFVPARIARLVHYIPGQNLPAIARNHGLDMPPQHSRCFSAGQRRIEPARVVNTPHQIVQPHAHVVGSGKLHDGVQRLKPENRFRRLGFRKLRFDGRHHDRAFAGNQRRILRIARQRRCGDRRTIQNAPRTADVAQRSGRGRRDRTGAERQQIAAEKLSQPATADTNATSRAPAPASPPPARSAEARCPPSARPPPPGPKPRSPADWPR